MSLVAVVRLATAVVAEVAAVGVVRRRLVVAPALRALVPNAKSVAKRATRLFGAGTGWMNHTMKNNHLQLLRRRTPTTWIQTGIMILVLRTISPVIWIVLPYERSTPVATRSKWAMEQVCVFCILVLVLFILILDLWLSTMFFMFQIYLSISYQFINYLVTIMCFLNFILGLILSRIEPPGSFFLKESVNPASTLLSHLMLRLYDKLLCLLPCSQISGMHALVIHPRKLLGLFFVLIIYLVPRSLPCHQFVMPVS
jgi:hypothetical protein